MLILLLLSKNRFALPKLRGNQRIRTQLGLKRWENSTCMQNLTDLRQYYNHTIHPELKRMETRRHHLLMTLWVSFMAILGIIFLQFYFGIIVLTLVLIIPVVLYVSYIFSEWESFRTTFKPRVISLLLDFIDNDVTYNVPLKYIEKG